MFSVSFTFSELISAVKGKWIGTAPALSQSVHNVFTDTREQAPDSVFFAFSGEAFDAHDFLDKAVSQGAAVLVVDNAKSHKVPAGVYAIGVESTLTAFQALAEFHRDRFPDLKVIALTGSCGKTSTKETLRAIFEYAYGPDHVLATIGNTNNQIGVPQNLFRLTSQHKIAILEMGTNHFGELEPLSKIAKPDAALVVSIGRCHLEFFKDLDGVAREKRQVFSHLKPGGIAVIPCESAGNQILRETASGFRMYTFGFSNDADMTAEYHGGNLHGAAFRLTCKSTGETEMVQWRIPGRHQSGNAAGAAMLAFAMGIPLKKIAAGMGNTTLPGLRMRISEHCGATWINDSYNANPDSMNASLTWLSEFADPSKLVLVLGDMGELGDNAEQAHLMTAENARKMFPDTRIVLVGPKMSRSLQNDPAVLRYPSSEDAGKHISDFVNSGDMVFLKASRSTKMERIEPAEE